MNDVEVNKNSLRKIELYPGDELRVYSKNIYSRKKNIVILGDVKNPGIYESSSKMFLNDFILMAGGLVNVHDSFRVDVEREENGKYSYTTRIFKNDSTLLKKSQGLLLKLVTKFTFVYPTKVQKVKIILFQYLVQ